MKASRSSCISSIRCTACAGACRVCSTKCTRAEGRPAKDDGEGLGGRPRIAPMAPTVRECQPREDHAEPSYHQRYRARRRDAPARACTGPDRGLSVATGPPDHHHAGRQPGRSPCPPLPTPPTPPPPPPPPP